MKEITTTTIYEEKVVKTFLKDFYNERMKTTKIILNILIGTIIIYTLTKDKITTVDIITFVFAALGILEINTNILPNINYYKLSKKKDSILNTKIKYTFKKDNFKISSNKDEYIEYSELKKIIEVEKAYYLYITNSRALIVDKTNLSEDKQEKLTNIFKEKVSTYKYKK